MQRQLMCTSFNIMLGSEIVRNLYEGLMSRILMLYVVYFNFLLKYRRCITFVMEIFHLSPNESTFSVFSWKLSIRGRAIRFCGWWQACSWTNINGMVTSAIRQPQLTAELDHVRILPRENTFANVCWQTEIP
jgi:hypothetical protein